jgi:hypothetical protein
MAKRRNNASGNDVAIISRMKKMASEICAPSFGNTKAKNHCRKSRTSAAANRASSLLESQL